MEPHGAPWSTMEHLAPVGTAQAMTSAGHDDCPVEDGPEELAEVTHGDAFLQKQRHRLTQTDTD